MITDFVPTPHLRKKNGPGTRLTLEEQTEVLRLARAGYDAVVIAKHFGVGRTQISKLRKRNNLSPAVHHNQETLKQVKTLLALNYSTAQAAKKLGMSKGQVIGLASRHKLRRPIQQQKSKLDTIQSISSQGCRWIDGAPRPIREDIFCGAPIDPRDLNHAWCQEHRSRVYIHPKSEE